MWISINKDWFEKNKLKFLEASDGEEECFVIDLDGTQEIQEIQDNKVLCVEEDEGKIFVSIDVNMDTESIVTLVENSIDDIKGDSLSKIIELVVKKLNKLRTFLESIRGL